MSKSYLVPQDFQSVNLGSVNTTINVAGSTFTAGPDVSGEIIILNATGGSVVTVPSLVSGLDLTFIVSNTGAHTITVPTGTLHGTAHFPYAGTAGTLFASANAVIATTVGSVVGDQFNITSDGTKCYLTGSVRNFNSFRIVS